MAKKALIIVDMSNDFVHDKGSLTAGTPAQAIVPYIVKKADEFLTNGDIVVVAMDTHRENDTHFALWPPHNVEGTWGHELYGDLATWYETNRYHQPEDGDDLTHTARFIPKENYNAFHNTMLDYELNYLGVREVHVVGVCTDICVFLTVAGADASGFQTVVHRPGVATFSPHGDVFIEQMAALFHTKIIE